MKALRYYGKPLSIILVILSIFTRLWRVYPPKQKATGLPAVSVAGLRVGLHAQKR
jgi:hypothetical protein